MKKLFVYAGLACAAALSLTNCSKIDPQTPSSEGMPFEIVASTAETKTANDGLKTTWVDGDALNLFHAETGTTNYFKEGEFTLVSGDKFTGNLNTDHPLETGKNYDWYALYPYNENIKTPAATTSGYTFIGHRTGATQQGNSSTAHLSCTKLSALCPLYGVAKGVAADKSVKIDMHHLTSVVKIVVTNNNDAPLTVSTVTLTAGEDIVGSYYIDFTGETVKYTASGEEYVKKTATLNVSDGTALAKGESAAFYIPIKPFTATKGSELTVAVNGYAKPKTLDADKTFVAGTIHQIGFSYDKKASTSSYATTYTSNVELTTTGGTKASTVKVAISGTEYDALKLGTSSKAGSAKVDVPAGTKKLHIHAVGWKGDPPTVTISGATSSPSTLTLSPDEGVSGNNTTFTLKGNAADYYYELVLSDITAKTTITFTSDKERFVLFGVNAE